jgi:circadian clock protein KaiC
METSELTGTELRLPMQGVSPLAETLVLLRYAEFRSRLHRFISVFKVRDADFDPAIREFSITNAGIVIGKPFEDAEGVLTGVPREASTRAAAPKRARTPRGIAPVRRNE